MTRRTYRLVWAWTAWLADLSLREVIPPPMSLSLDQRAYDAADAVGVASVAIARHVSPARVRFTLAGADGKLVARRTAPFRTDVPIAPSDGQAAGGVTVLTEASLRRCRIVFAPRGLSAGDHETKVELLDAEGKVLAVEKRTFRRLGE